MLISTVGWSTACRHRAHFVQGRHDVHQVHARVGCLGAGSHAPRCQCWMRCWLMQQAAARGAALPGSTSISAWKSGHAGEALPAVCDPRYGHLGGDVPLCDAHGASGLYGAAGEAPVRGCHHRSSARPRCTCTSEAGAARRGALPHVVMHGWCPPYSSASTRIPRTQLSTA